MFLGHYGVAFGAKRVSPRTSLGALAFAAEWLDELWPILLLAGLEQVRVVPGLMAANPLDFVSYPISHSLAAAVGWGLLVAGVYYALRRDRRGATVLGALVLSHWVLDYPMHRPDLPLWPGSPVRVGLGAWRSIPLTILLDCGVFAIGLTLYLRATRARDAIARWALWTMVVFLVSIFVSGFTSPPPVDQRTIALSTLGLWLFVPWSWWVDRHRVPT
jgi:hypothetical protein